MNANDIEPEGRTRPSPPTEDRNDPRYLRITDPHLAAYADQFQDEIDAIPTYGPTVGCVIPAYNEGDTIAGVLDSLPQQTRLPDAIHVVINNTTDDSVEVASHYAGPHTRTTPVGEAKADQ